MAQQPKPRQNQPPKAPQPGSQPKPPRNVFNHEKKGGDVTGEKRGK